MTAQLDTGDRATGNFAVLRADTLSLLLPLAGLGAATYLEAIPAGTEVRGLFTTGDAVEQKFIVAPSARLRPLAKYPSGRFVLVPMDFTGKQVFVAWSEMKVLIDAQLEVHALPPALADADGPVADYVMIAGRPVFRTDPGRLLDFMLSGAGPDD